MAARLATVEGIEGLSLGRLADSVGMSKSGLFAHFRSKEELQLATIETADAIFRAEVVDPALDAAPGITRLRALCEAFLAHLERGVFPGGCFFASVAAEIDTHPAPYATTHLRPSRRGSSSSRPPSPKPRPRTPSIPTEDPTQIAFELDSYLLLANAQYVAAGDPAALDRARRAIDRLLQSVAPASGQHP